MTDKDKAIQESERIAAADEYFKARTWIMDTSDNRRIFEAGFDRAYALLSKLRAPVADELPPWEQVATKRDHGEPLTPLELFIYDNEPAGGDAAWRDQLAAALVSAPVAGMKPLEPEFAKVLSDNFESLLLRAPVASAPVAGEYTSAMGEAAQSYLDSFPYAHKLPAQFRWSDLWQAMRNAEPQSSTVAGEAQPLGYVAEWCSTNKQDGRISVCSRSRITTKHQAELTAKQWAEKSPQWGPMRVTAVYAAPQASEAQKGGEKCRTCGGTGIAASVTFKFGGLPLGQDVERCPDCAALSAQPGAQRTGGGDAE